MSDIQKQRLKMNMARMKDMHKQRMQSMKDRLESMPDKKDTKKEERDLLGKYMPEAKRMNKKELESDTEEERDEKVERMRQQQSKVMELNKYTLAKYQQGAAQDLATRSMDQGSGIKGYATDKNRKKVINRVVGIGKAANKLTQKTNEENIDELKTSTLKSYLSKVKDKHSDMLNPHVDDYEPHKVDQERNSGRVYKGDEIARAKSKLAKRGVNELKTPTLKSYISKASKDLEQNTGKDKSKFNKRDLAIDKAKGRLSMNRQLGRAEESVQDEGVLGAIGGGIVGGMLGGPAGALAGAYGGHKIQQQRNKIKKLQAKKGVSEDESVVEKAMGLYYNINKKRKEGRPMRKKGAQGAPKVSDFARAKQTASEENTETIEQTYARKVARELLDMTESGHVTKHKAKLAKGSDYGDSGEEDFKHAKGMSDDQMHKFAKRYAGVGNYKGKPSRALRRAIRKNPNIPFRQDHLKDHVEIMEDGHQDVASARRKAVLIMEDASQMLMKLKNMDPMDSLPSWWMNKMSVTAAYMDSMRNYLLVPSEMPTDNMPTESYSMASSDTNPGMKRRKAPIMVATTPVSEKKEKKKKQKLIPMGPTSFGTGSYTDSGGGDASVGEETDAEKMKNIDKNMKLLRKMKPLKSMLGPEGPGMKKIRAKTDAISSTDKAGRSSRSRLISKYGRNINFGK